MPAKDPPEQASPQPSEGSTTLCPFCRAMVICVDTTRTILHANPVCGPFMEKMEELGLVARRAPWVATVWPREGEPS